MFAIHTAPRIFFILALFMYVMAVTVGIFTGGLWGIVGIWCSLLLYFGIWALERGHPPLPKNIVVSVLTVLCILALLDTQASSPDVSWHMLLQEATIMIPLALLFSPRVIAHIDKPDFFLVVSMAAAIGATLYNLEFGLGFPLLHIWKGPLASVTEYNRGASYFAVFSFPLMAYWWITGKRWQAILFTGLMVLPVLLTESRATRLAFFMGGMVTIIAHSFPNLTRRSLIYILLFLLTLPFMVTAVFIHHPEWIDTLPPSWQHRVEIWDYMSYRIFERPWVGWGLGSSHLLSYAQPHGMTYQYVKSAASHPHDAVIQLWVEVGIPGLILAASAAIALLQKASRFASPIIPFALGAWTAALCISSVAYSFWDDSLFSLFAMTMLAFIILARQLKHGEGHSNGTTA